MIGPDQQEVEDNTQNERRREKVRILTEKVAAIPAFVVEGYPLDNGA